MSLSKRLFSGLELFKGWKQEDLWSLCRISNGCNGSCNLRQLQQLLTAGAWLAWLSFRTAAAAKKKWSSKFVVKNVMEVV